MKYEVGGPI